MKVIVFGAGMMGMAAAHYLVHYADAEKVKILDRVLSQAEGIKQWLGSQNVVSGTADASDVSSVAKAIRGYDAMISCVPYKLNEVMARAAIKSRVNMVDLGGNNEIVRRELALNNRAKKAGVFISPDNGLAPGLVSILAKALVDEGEKNEIHLRVGGLPIDPQPPLDYALTFSVSGLVNEYIEPVTVLRNGRIRTVEPLEDIEYIKIRGFGTLEAFNTSGGISTLPETYQRKVRTLDYKTLRYPGHCEKIRLLHELGLTSSDPLRLNGKSVSPRSVLEKALLNSLPENGKDAVILKVWGRSAEYRCVQYYDKKTGFTAMQQMTAYPAAAVLAMISRGEIEARGVLPLEKYVNPGRVISEIRKCGIRIKKVLK